MPRHRSGSAGRGVEVDIVRVSVALENALGIGQLEPSRGVSDVHRDLSPDPRVAVNGPGIV